MTRLFKLTDHGGKAASSILPSSRDRVLDALYAHKGRVGFQVATLESLEIETGMPQRDILVRLRQLRSRHLVEEITA